MKKAPISVEEEIFKAYALYHGNSESEIGLYGGTFTAIDGWREILKKVNNTAEALGIKGIRISTRPDELNDAAFLAENGVIFVEIGAQSMVQEILDASERNHTVEDVKNAVKIVKANGMKVSVHLMTGLPKDTKEKSIFSAFEVSKLEPDGVRIHPALILKNTKLEHEYKSGNYRPQSLDEALDVVSDMLSIFKNDKISVERIGMYQDSETIKNVIAGPYHQAFGELALSMLYRKFLISNNAQEVHGPAKLRSQIAGRNGDLRIYFYDSEEIFILKDNKKILFDSWLSQHVSSLKEMIS